MYNICYVYNILYITLHHEKEIEVSAKVILVIP